MSTTYTTSVRPEWIDYNGHMNSGYYSVVIDNAVGDLLEQLGAVPYMKRTSGTFYTVETHIIYSRELLVNDSIRVETQIISYDRKRLHLFSTLYHGLDGFIVGSGESMILHYVQNEQRVLPMPDAFFAGVVAMAQEHAMLPVPPAVGKGIRAVDLGE